MPCRMAVEGDLMAVEVSLLDTPPHQQPGPDLSEISLGRESDELREQLEGELTHEARRILATDDVDVTVSFKPGSLLVTALIAGKVVADIGAFFAGAREIRGLFPQRIRDRVSEWLGRDVARRDVRVALEPGLMAATEAEAAKEPGDAATRPVTVKELSWYAVLSLAVLFVVAGLMVIGAIALT